MKKYLSIKTFFNLALLILFSGIMTFTSCDKIEPPFTENNENIDTSKCPPPQFPALVNNYRKILVEDFTGQKCGYCPRAHVALKNLITTYGDTIVGIALHVSDIYAAPDASGLFTYDFRTPEATEIDQTFHVSDAGLPKGMINRLPYNSNIIVSHTAWPTAVQALIGTTTNIGLQIINQYDNIDDSTFCTHCKITFLENISDTLMFFSGLIEDSIIKPQRNYDVTPNDIPAYVHMHVFRDGLNGSFGVTINPQFQKKDSSIVKSYFYDLHGKDYKLKNLRIVNYVYKKSSNEVIQAEEAKIFQ